MPTKASLYQTERDIIVADIILPKLLLGLKTRFKRLLPNVFNLEKEFRYPYIFGEVEKISLFSFFGIPVQYPGNNPFFLFCSVLYFEIRL